MRLQLVMALVLTGLAARCLAGSGNDLWGVGTLVNYPPDKSRKTVPPQANDIGDNSPIEMPCQCSDADPRDEVTQEVGTTCFYQRVYGGCNADNLFDADAELAPEGFCQMSCSRCSCCSPPSDVIRQLGATRFLKAAEAASPSLKDLLDHPGYSATILVPTDAAWEAAQGALAPLLQNPSVLQEVLKFHILPPEPTRNALWTTPFLSLGPKLYTLYDGPATLSTTKFPLPANTTWRGGLTGFSINGPHNSAVVTKSDVSSCKSYINLVDRVLLPFDPAVTPASSGYLASAAVLGASGCAVQPNAIVRGSQLRDGGSNLQESVGACCASCRAASGCNAWSFCAQRGGCAQVANVNSKVPFGWCALKSSPEVAAGKPAAYEDFSAVTVPVISGYLVAAPTAAQSSPGGRRLS